MELNTYIPIVKLYELFFTKPISTTILLNREHTPQPYQQQQQQNLLSPMSKQIYQSAYTPDKPKLLQEFIKDDLAIETLEQQQYKDDPDYQEKLENGGLGFYMESFIAFHGLCPLCGQKTLRKYIRSNIPVVDLICINKSYHEANNSCFLFQIKTTLSDLYFNKSQQYIMVGSKQFGYNSHIVKGSDDIKKKTIVIGYICISLDRNILDNTKYKINKQKSFVLIPNLLNTKSENYYEYTQSIMNKNVIKWNNNLVNMYNITNVLNVSDVNTMEIFNETFNVNPYNNLPLKILGKLWQDYINTTKKTTKRYKLTF